MNAVSMRGISRRYPGVLALDNADFDLRAGEVHIVAGENGAGKSTLMKVLAGSVQPDAGHLEINGQHRRFFSPLDAIRSGVAAVYQEFALCPHLTVTQNIFLGREPGTFFINKRLMREKSELLLARIGAHCSPDDIVAQLGTAQMQLVEIARALANDFQVLILDEPTAALSERETAVLFNAVKALKAAGKSIAYISHRLEEFAEIGDRVTVMRNGKVITTLEAATATIPELVSAMAGKDITELFPARAHHEPSTKAAPLLRVQNLSQKTRLRNISFDLRAGEIIGLAGLVGSGRTRLLRTLFGIERPTRGRIEIEGHSVKGGSISETIRGGMGLVPEDRKTQGLLLDMSVAKNISVANLSKVSTGPFVSGSRENMLAGVQCNAAHVKTPSVSARVSTLSGGNQQKVVVARWLARECRVLLLDEPARGVDVGARFEIFKLIAQFADEGHGVIMVSSYLPEILGMADRILVMHRGEIAAEFPARGVTQEQIIHAASMGSAA